MDMYNIMDAKRDCAYALAPPELAFTSAYFLESGLFNGLQPIQIKFFLDLQRV